jgi:hypothetical protein
LSFLGDKVLGSLAVISKDLILLILNGLVSFRVTDLQLCTVAKNKDTISNDLDTFLVFKVGSCQRKFIMMKVFSSHNIKALLGCSIGKELFSSGSRHNIGALHKVEYDHVKLRFISLIVELIPVNLFSCGDHYSIVASDSKDEATKRQSMIRLTDSLTV